jgi:hypothetical protein
MNRRVPALVAGAFIAGALAGALAIESAARPSRAPAPSQYTNATYNFTLTPPSFPRVEKDGRQTVATFFAPSQENLAANLIVVVQAAKTSLDDFIGQSKGDMQKLGLRAVVETKLKVSGREAVYWEYESVPSRRPLKVILLAVLDGERIFVLNGTALASNADVLKEFKSSVDSFRLAD